MEELLSRLVNHIYIKLTLHKKCLIRTFFLIRKKLDTNEMIVDKVEIK